MTICKLTIPNIATYHEQLMQNKKICSKLLQGKVIWIDSNIHSSIDS